MPDETATILIGLALINFPAALLAYLALARIVRGR